MSYMNQERPKDVSSLYASSYICALHSAPKIKAIFLTIHTKIICVKALVDNCICIKGGIWSVEYGVLLGN